MGFLDIFSISFKFDHVQGPRTDEPLREDVQDARLSPTAETIPSGGRWTASSRFVLETSTFWYPSSVGPRASKGLHVGPTVSDTAPIQRRHPNLSTYSTDWPSEKCIDNFEGSRADRSRPVVRLSQLLKHVGPASASSAAVISGAFICACPPGRVVVRGHDVASDRSFRKVRHLVCPLKSNGEGAARPPRNVHPCRLTRRGNAKDRRRQLLRQGSHYECEASIQRRRQGHHQISRHGRAASLEAIDTACGSAGIAADEGAAYDQAYRLCSCLSGRSAVASERRTRTFTIGWGRTYAQRRRHDHG